MRSRLAAGLLILLSIAGIGALVSMAVAGPEPRWRWGYVAAMLSFLLSAGQLAPVLSMASRVGRGYWGAPVRRVGDLLALSGLVSAPLLILLVNQLPEWRGRPSIWFDWPFAPGVYNAVAGIGLAFGGAALVGVVTWPEHRWRGWFGTPTRWRVLTRTTIALGGMYTMLAVFVHLVVVSDLAISLVPGWHSAVIPPYHIVSGFEAAIALVVVVSSVSATTALGQSVIRSVAKLLLALSLLWFYFIWSELLTYWYGRTPDELSLLRLFMFGPGLGLFIVAVVCNFLIPLCTLVWNSARGSRTAVTVVAVVVVFGNLVDRMRLFVAAWSVATPTPTDHLPEDLAPLPIPGPVEVLACAGVLALAGLAVAAALSRISPVSEWEVKAVERLTPERQVLRTRTRVVARPS